MLEILNVGMALNSVPEILESWVSLEFSALNSDGNLLGNVELGRFLLAGLENFLNLVGFCLLDLDCAWFSEGGGSHVYVGIKICK